MSAIAYPTEKPKRSISATLRIAAVSLSALAAMSLGAAAYSVAPATSLTRSIDVDADPAAVWSLIGNFCAIKDWHPMIATCSTDGGAPPIRTVVAKDGTTRFVEREVGRDDVEHLYSYNFVSSPLPAANYLATIRVVPRGNGTSTVIWSGSYTPVDGRGSEANAALAGIYESGLVAIRAKFTR